GVVALQQILLGDDTLPAGRDPASQLEAHVLDELVRAGPGAARREQRSDHVVVYGHVHIGRLRIDVERMGCGVVAAQRARDVESAALHAEGVEDARLHGLSIALTELASGSRYVSRDKAGRRSELIGVLVSLAELRGRLHLRKGRDLQLRREAP